MVTIVLAGFQEETFEAARLLASAAAEENQFVQLIPLSDFKKIGPPKIALVKITPAQIDITLSYKPDAVLLETAQLKEFELAFQNLQERSHVFINADKELQIKNYTTTAIKTSQFGLIGALSATTNLIQLKTLLKTTEQIFNNKDKIKKEIQTGYELVRKKILGVLNDNQKS